MFREARRVCWLLFVLASAEQSLRSGLTDDGTDADKIAAREFMFNIRSVGSEVHVAQSMGETDIFSELDRLTSLEDVSKNEAENAKQETSAIQQAVDRMTSTVAQPLMKAMALATEFEQYQERSKTMLDQIYEAQKNIEPEMGSLAELTENAMNTKFKKVFNDMSAFADRHIAETDSKIEKAQMRFKSADGKLKAESVNFKDEVAARELTLFHDTRNSKSTVNLAKKNILIGLKELGKKQKEMRKKLNTLYATRTNYFVLKPTLDLIKKIETSTAVEIETKADAFVQASDKSIHDSQKEYGTLRLKAVQLGIDYVRQTVLEKQAIEAKSVDHNEKSMKIGTDMDELQKTLIASNSDVKTRIGQTVGDITDKMMRFLSTVGDRTKGLKKITIERAPFAVGMIEKVSSGVRDTNVQGAAQLGEALGESVAAVDQTVTDLLTNIEPARNSMQEGARNVEIQAQSAFNNGKTMDAMVAAADLNANRRATIEAQQLAQAKSRIEMSMTEAQQMGRIALSKYVQNSDADKDRLDVLIKLLVSKLQMPIDEAVKFLKKRLTERMESARMDRDEDLAPLEKRFASILQILEANAGKDDKLVGVEIPLFYKQFGVRRQELEDKLAALLRNRERTRENVEKMTQVRILQAINDEIVDVSKAKMKQKQRVASAMKKRFTDAIKVKSAAWDFAIRHKAMVEDSIRSRKYILNELNGDTGSPGLIAMLDDVKKAMKMQFVIAQDKVQVIHTTSTADLFNIAQLGNHDATTSFSLALADAKATDEQHLTSSEASLYRRVKELHAKVQSRIRFAIESVIQQFDAHEDRMDKALEEKRARIDKMGTLARIAADKRKLNQEVMAKRSEFLVSAAERVRTAARAAPFRMKKDSNAAVDRNADEVDGMIRRVAHDQESAQRGATGAVQEALRELQLQGERSKHIVKQAVKDTRSVVQTVGKSLTSAQRFSEAAKKTTQERVRAVEREVGAKLKVAASEEAGKATDTDEDVQAMGNSYKGVLDQSANVVNAVNSKQDDDQMANENEQDKFADQVEMLSKTVHAAQKASLMGIQSAIDNGKAAQATTRYELQFADKTLYGEASALNQSRARHEYETQQKVRQFTSGIKTLGTELKADLKFIDNFEAYAVQKELSLVKDTADLLTTTARQVDKTFDDILDQETKFTKEAAALEGGSDYGKMKKIRLASLKIYAGLAEDKRIKADLVVNNDRQLPWMSMVLEKLEEEHATILAAQAKRAEDQDKEKDSAAANLGEIVTKVQQEIVGASIPEYDQLGNTSDEIFSTLDVGLNPIDSIENNTLNNVQANLNSEDMSAAQDFAELANSTFAHDKEARSGTDAVRNINYDIHKMHADDHARAASFKAAIDDRFERILTKADQGTQGARFVYDLLQTSDKHEGSPRLAALLQENAHLSAEQAGLSQEHEELGAQVHQVVLLDRQLRQGSTIEESVHRDQTARPLGMRGGR